MPSFVCTTCGTQYPPSDKPPTECIICSDERQYVTAAGQGWTTLENLRHRHMNAIRELEPNLISITTFPAFGINQRTHLLRTPHGNILWDCIALVDNATVEMIKAMGGIKAIAISHPHYYTTMLEWSNAFDGVPIYLHEADRNWVQRDGPAIVFWSGSSKELLPGVTLICAGGHYPGGSVLHWADGAEGRGTLLSGDIVHVVHDRKSVSFMWSFPNFIPLSAPRVEGVVNAIKPYKFDRIHGAFTDRTIWSGAQDAVKRSTERYLNIILGDGSYELQ
ncbi:MBL fold metallo-hydrolase [Methylovirgula ligni]|uniref:Metallo-beta-lactamase domain-containing protein n=1 Tax=Methylovirgula ligni TaxID=569860 RepID=A0A3D9Z1T5_9HYPH|nr:MBL fold metallo-hydrolase [Methylovirgula ligni]QAY95528.1 MBL fold metallo-hydrolase [Methylovirgula ligni]REF89133.1 hypothetical protein DES32_0348 [Methylovirgula ligni]